MPWLGLRPLQTKTVVLASGSFNMLFAASMMVSGRIEVDMFILPFEVLFDEEVMVGGSGGRSTHVRVWSTGL